MKHFLSLTLIFLTVAACAQTGNETAPLVVGPVALNCIDKPCSGASVTANALGSGVNGPLTAQTGMSINIQKDNWFTGGKVVCPIKTGVPTFLGGLYGFWVTVYFFAFAVAFNIAAA